MAVSFLKKGAESHSAMEKADQQSKLKAESQSSMWRFWIEPGQEAPITFVDGDLTSEGLIDINTYNEHTVFMNGSWGNHFVCLSGTPEEPCPLCEEGDEPSFVGVLTIIDHRSVKSKKDPTKVYKDRPRLFVAKRETIKVLQNMAAKRGGLAGCRFDVTRTDGKSARVGNHFDFMGKTPVEELKAKYFDTDKDGKKVPLFVPANYEKEIIFRKRDELLKLMKKGPSATVGGEGDPAAEEATSESYAKHL